MRISNDQFIRDLRDAVGTLRGNMPATRRLLVKLTMEVGRLTSMLGCTEAEIDAMGLDVYAQAVSVAAMAMRLATEGDTDYPEYKPK